MVVIFFFLALEAIAILLNFLTSSFLNQIEKYKHETCLKFQYKFNHVNNSSYKSQKNENFFWP